MAKDWLSAGNPFINLPSAQFPQVRQEILSDSRMDNRHKYQALQNLSIAYALRSEQHATVEQRDVTAGRVTGTVYFNKMARASRAVLLVAGTSASRHIYDTLARRLAAHGYYCLAIDLPGHFINTRQLSLGEISETVTAGILYVKSVSGCSRVGVIAHSLGAIGALFNTAGYTVGIEEQLKRIWHALSILALHKGEILLALQKISQLERPRKGLLNYDFKAEEAYEMRKKELISMLSGNEAEFATAYIQLKELILYSLKSRLITQGFASSYIFLGMPDSLRNAFPASCLIMKFPKPVIKVLWESTIDRLVRKAFVKGGYTVPEKKGGPFGPTHWGYYKTDDPKEFIRYFVSCKTPSDFLQLVEQLGRFMHKDQGTTFMEYYQKKYLLALHKLFIYGSNDFFLQSFIPSHRRRVESFYQSCGNAIIKTGSFSHFLATEKDTTNVLASAKRIMEVKANVATNDAVTTWIIRFLDSTV